MAESTAPAKLRAKVCMSSSLCMLRSNFIVESLYGSLLSAGGMWLDWVVVYNVTFNGLVTCVNVLQ